MHKIYYDKLRMKRFKAFCSRKTKTTGKILIVLTLAVGLVFSSTGALFAQSLQDQINALDRDIATKESTLKDISARADNLQNKLDSINAEIAALDSKIQRANLEIEQTNAQIDETKAKLDKQKKIMYENARVLYKEGDISTLEVLASSDNFTDFVNRQEYLETVKENVNKAAREVVALKTALEANLEKLKNVIAEANIQRSVQTFKQQEQAELVAETRGQEANYQAMVNNLKQQQAAAQAALAASISNGNYKVAPAGSVSAGDIVGSVGSSGMSTGPHLHLEVRIGSSTTDPAPYIQVQPVQPPVVTQSYGNPDPIYQSGRHPGIDYGGSMGQAIFAIAPGNMYRGCSSQLFGHPAYGYVAVVDSGSYITIYAHMSGGGC